jgi:DNA polymerase eta
VDVVAAAGNKLWKELIGVDDSVPLKITHVSLSFTGIEGVESGLQGIDTFFKSGQKRSLEADPANDQAGTSERSSRNISKDLSSYVCGKCAFKSSLPPSATRSEAERDDALHKIYMEHTDFHLALDLSKVPSKPSPVRAESKPKSVGPKEKKRRKESPKGIEKFFGKS